jgi:maleylacetoacetate isomerase
MKLYTYFRSSTSYRVRIALALKGLNYESVPVSLLKNEQSAPAYTALNPMAGLPALEHEGRVISQSLAMIEYLEAHQPAPSLFPGSAQDQAFARQIALAIATDIHPLINLKVGAYLSERLGADDIAKKDWIAHWTMKGMRAVEAMLKGRAGNFALGDRVSVADLCIIPQMYSLRRNGLPAHELPLCCAIEKHCITLEPFIQAAPEMQGDALPDLEPIHGPHAPILKQAA